VGSHELIGVSGLHEYLPRLDDLHLEDITTIDELRQEHPEYAVLNADYALAVPGGTGWGSDDRGPRARGTRLPPGRHVPAAVAGPWLPSGHPDLVGAREEKVVFSTLRNIRRNEKRSRSA
jgi:hypothetical protein